MFDLFLWRRADPLSADNEQNIEGDCQHRAKAGKEIQPRLCRCFPVVGARGDEKSAADDQYRRDTQQSRHMFFCELRVESSAAGAREIEIKKEGGGIQVGWGQRVKAPKKPKNRR